MPPVDSPTPGLRERKKARTRETLRREAFRLFRDQGYAQTTVEQIAAAAEVSPSTFFRYFPNKEELAIADDFDAVVIEHFRAQPADSNVFDALRAAIRSVTKSMTPEQERFEDERQQLMSTEPQLQGALRREGERNVDLVAGLIAEHTGLQAEDLRIRAIAGALIGGYQALHEPPNSALRSFDVIGFLAEGMPLDGPPVLPKARRKRSATTRRRA